jgi:hypothetical protein
MYFPIQGDYTSEVLFTQSDHTNATGATRYIMIGPEQNRPNALPARSTMIYQKMLSVESIEQRSSNKNPAVLYIRTRGQDFALHRSCNHSGL